ncbi:MAPEG family protein [Devosia faecipullorum]|uniref:MAPEG family protein n=1 Tax=Devosia faecipullorum TaxID=2755039 RepID=UPI00187B41A4|nr:MAPEG family protein [Devosia faecipullorum]MBE7732525.1 MAPEG family protein [Devosia faecipullorum]
MSIELTMLIWSAVLALAYVIVQSTAYRLDYGVRYAGSQRDNERSPNKWAARGERALRNFLETYGIFIALAVATELSGRSDGLTQWGTQIWFWARGAYLPAYFIDVPLMRSAFWMVSLIGLVLIFVGVAF